MAEPSILIIIPDIVLIMHGLAREFEILTVYRFNSIYLDVYNCQGI